MQKKIRITFMLSSNMQSWAGGKKTIYEYIKFANRERFEVQIVQPFQYHPTTLSKEQLQNMFKGVKITEFDYPLDYLASRLHSERLMVILSNPILPFRKLIFWYTRLRNLSLLRRVETETDYFYVLNNDLAEILSGKSKIIGCEHTYIPGMYNGKPVENIFAKLALSLTKVGFLYRHIMVFHCINKFSEYYISPYKKAFYVPNGVDTNLFYPEECPHETIRLLFVGRIVPSKGIKELVEAFRMVDDKNIELHVVGGGSLANLFSEPKDSGIYYHGFLSDEQMAEIYRKCDVFVFPSYYETFGLVIIEALSSGLYVITSEQIYPRFIDFQKEGYLEYVPINEVSISNAIKSLQKNKHKILNFDERKKLHEIVKKEFEWKTIVENLYEKIISY